MHILPSLYEIQEQVSNHLIAIGKLVENLYIEETNKIPPDGSSHPEMSFTNLTINNSCNTNNASISSIASDFQNLLFYMSFDIWHKRLSYA